MNRTTHIAFALLLSTFGVQAEEVSPIGFFMQQAQSSVTPVKVERQQRRVKAPLPPERPFDLPTYVPGRLTCAINVNRLLAMKGVEGTGTARALDFLSWGHPTAPKPGAVQIERRGRNSGHVRVVSHHDGSGWQCLNPSARRQSWTLTPCSEGRVIAWRIAA
jgi:hypothetical protein